MITVIIMIFFMMMVDDDDDHHHLTFEFDILRTVQRDTFL